LHLPKTIIFFIGVNGPIKNQKKSTVKFTNGRKTKYKRVAILKKESKCHFYEEKRP
jgi:hypothetical protein